MRTLRFPLLCLLGISAALLPASVHAGGGSAYVVDRVFDEGEYTACTPAPADCSLRGAMSRADVPGTPGDLITFDAVVFPPGAPVTIYTSSSLSLILDGGDTIDGTGSGVIINGNGRSLSCITVGTPGNTIKGLQVSECDAAFAVIGDAASGNIIGPGNVIYDNSTGIEITVADDTTVKGNYIGTTADGSAVHPSGGNSSGIMIIGTNSQPASGNVIGGETPGDRNVISGNLDGVFLDTFASMNTVKGNYIGTDATGTIDLGNGGNGVAIFGTDNTVGGTATGAGNLISGNGQGVYIHFQPPAGGNVIQGNYIGTDATGSVALGNSEYGVLLQGQNNLLGGSTAGARNVISSNENGVLVVGPHTIQGNYIGTNAAGNGALGNLQLGVYVLGPAVIGGAIAGAGNVISGNHDGIFVDATSAIIQGNYIGLTADGTAALGNADQGLVLSSFNVVGGTASGAGNVISANYRGMWIAGWGNVIQGNRVGTDATGSYSIGNTEIGVYVAGESNVIGGTAAGAGNLISGNSSAGVWIVAANSNILQGNRIGTDDDGGYGIGNGFAGIAISTQSGTQVGGQAQGAGNLIAYNNGPGIYISGGDAHAIRHNSIHSNAGLGIDIDGDGVTANDPGDADCCTNYRQNFPALTSAFTNADTATLSILGTLGSAASTAYTLDFYSNLTCDATGYGEGKTYLGSHAVVTNAAGDTAFVAALPLTGLAGPVITATATDPTGNTSEFSACATIVPTSDADGDGSEQWAEAIIGTSDQDPCGNTGWPLDLVSAPPSANRADIVDLGSYIAPVRRLNLADEDPAYDVRWDIIPNAVLDIADLGAFLSGATGYPPMLGGARAYGSLCPFPP